MRHRRPRVKIMTDEDWLVDGRWLLYRSELVAGKQHLYYSKSAATWDRMQERCSATGRVQRVQSTYLGCQNLFASYQDFAAWCDQQPGYREKDELGRPWQLDKDIAMPGSMAYSPESCCFVPARINTFLTFRPSSRGILPLGVHRSSSGYQSRISIAGNRIQLGTFKTPSLAHSAWQSAKVQALKHMAESLGAVHQKAIAGLLLHAEVIQKDIDNQRETIR